MSEAERMEIPDETTDVDAPQETESEPVVDEQPEVGADAAALADISGMPPESEEGVLPEETEAKGEPAHALSGATMESLSRTDEQSLAEAEAERTKWERMRSQMKERLLEAYQKYMDDGGYKLGISLVTAVIAASLIVIAGLFSDRMISVVLWRAVVGFCVAGVFMGGVLYWLDKFGIPLFIAKNEEQLQMEWLSEAEEPEQTGEEVSEAAEEAEPGELEELMPQPDENASGEEAPAGTSGSAANNPGEEPNGETAQEASVGQEEPPQEKTEEEQPPGEEAEGIENAVLDDAFSSGEAGEEENEEPPSFTPMTAENLESLSVPES